MKLTSSSLVLAAAGLTAALPHLDSPRQRLLNGLELPDKYYRFSKEDKGTPYTPEHRDPYDVAIDPVKDDLDPLPWRNGKGASVLGPWNPERSRQSPDMVRPPSTDHGNVANMRWSFADSHIRIEVGPPPPPPGASPSLSPLVFWGTPHPSLTLCFFIYSSRRAAGLARRRSASCPPASSWPP